jgi:hypothetical protein
MKLDWERQLRTELRRGGWSYLHCPRMPTMEAIASLLGRVVTGTKYRSVLRARDRDDARPGTFSAAVGYGAQPFHTDGAHWALPPRYVILRVLNEGTATGTDVVDLFGPSLNNIRRTMMDSAWRVRGGPYSFACSGAAAMNGTTLFRLDPMCMTPMNSLANQLIAGCSRDILARFAETVDWCSFGTLVLDNWRVLHRRRRMEKSEQRIVARTYVGA